ncbi:MAG: glycoside hydrolase family 28 protein [Saprospiraceae bacterium]
MRSLYLFFPFFLLTFLFSCKEKPKNDKSELVTRLESIFYDPAFVTIPDQTFNVADNGAIGDGQTLATQAIQMTIDAAAKAGGGKVIFPQGTFLSGALFLKSNVELHLDEGVTIQAIQDDSQYPEHKTRIAGLEMEWPSALINVYQQKNVRITGKGIIDGNGKFWWDKFWGDPPRSGGMWVEYKEKDIRWAVDYDCKRVRPVVVYESEDVLLKDFTVKRAGFWTISLTYSERIYVDGLIIRNNIGGFGPSSDGINSDSSKDILVENCDIDCNDDNLCIKAGRDADGLRVNRPAENIVYRNCITRSGHGLFTIGSETSGGMRNIEVYGLEAIGTNTGIRFKSAQVRGGLIENIWFHDIKMKDVDSPFHFELNWYPEYSYPSIPATIPEAEIQDRWKLLTQVVEPPERGIPEFRNIRLSNITVEGAKEAFYANAFPEKPIRNLTWENITIEAEKSGSLHYANQWRMKNVSLTTQSQDSILFKNSTQIEHPTFFPQAAGVDGASAKPQQSVAAQIANLLTKNDPPFIIPVNSATEMLIFEGDTIPPLEEISVFVFPNESSSIEFQEPLGDGFYFSPLKISNTVQPGGIEVMGQKDHHWVFNIKSEKPPQSVTGSDSWTYHAEEQSLVIEKTGKSFKLQYK